MKIKLATLSDERFTTIGELSTRVMAAYCARRGYEFVCYKHLPDPSRCAVWNKTRIVQQELPTCDWLLWMDGDSIPVNHDFAVEKLIENVPDKDLIINGDFGIFAARNCAWTMQFFQTLWFVGQMDSEYAKRYHHNPQPDHPSMLALRENFPDVASRMFELPKNFVCDAEKPFIKDCFAMHYYSSVNDHWAIARKIQQFISNGWTQAAHQDLQIATNDNSPNRSQNELLGYEVFEYPSDFEKTGMIRDALTTRKQFVVYMDTRSFAICRFDEVNTGDYDVGVMMRRAEERGATSEPLIHGFLDSAVMFFNPTPAAFLFLDLWETQEAELMGSMSDQEALNILVLQATDLTEYDKVFVWQGIRIKVFRCEDYCFSRWPQEPLPTTKIVHCNRVESLNDWGFREWPV